VPFGAPASRDVACTVVFKRLATALAFVAVAAALTGCVAIKSIGNTQLDIVGKVRTTVVICASQSPAGTHPGCDIATNSGEGGSSDMQVLLGYRVPAGVGVPLSLSGTTNDAAPQQLTFTRSASYEADLTKLLPPGAGRKWVGYVSGTYAYDPGADGTVAREVSVSTDFALPRSSDGGPFVGFLKVRPVTGARRVSADLPATRPVDCGDSPYGGGTFLGDVPTMCVDWPLAAQVGTDLNVPTRDFGVATGGATASPGQTVSLPFDVRGAGLLPAGLTATLTAATGLPGVTVSPSVGSAPLAQGSSTRVTVPVTVPKGAAPGVYDVSVTGRIPNGQTRTGVAKLTVRDRQDPKLSALRIAPKLFKPGFKVPAVAVAAGTRVSYALSEPAGVRISVERCVKRAGKSPQLRKRCTRFKAAKGGSFTRGSAAGKNGFRLTGFIRGKPLSAGPYRLTATPTDSAGNRGAVARARFTVRR